MSNVSKALIITALSMLSSQAFAEWQADCAQVDQQAQTGTCAAITSTKAGLDIYQPPAPCADKDPGVTFNVSSPSAPPATLNPADGSCSGGGSTPSTGGSSGSSDVLQGSGTSGSGGGGWQ